MVIRGLFLYSIKRAFTHYVESLPLVGSERHNALVKGGRWIGFGVTLRGGYCACLRTGEMISMASRTVKIMGGRLAGHSSLGGLAWADINTPISIAASQAASSTRAFIRIENAKNRRYLGSSQFATIDDKGSALWVEWMLLEASSDEAVFPGSDFLEKLPADVWILAERYVSS